MSDSGSAPVLALEPTRSPLWKNAIGQGFRRSVWTLSLEVGAGGGLATYGSRPAHDLALLSLAGGRRGRTRGEGHWYRGNWELRAELFGGA